MVRISDLSEELLVKILTFLPTKVAVSTSILSKQWQFLWMWLPKLEFDDCRINASSALSYRDFIDKNLPSHRAPVIESLLLRCCRHLLLQPENIKRWVEIAVSRFVRELSISYFDGKPRDVLSLPSSLYTCNSLMTLKLEGKTIVVDVPQIVCLPSLKTLKLESVTYSNEGSLGLLLSHCPVLEDLLIEPYNKDDNVRALVVNVPSLQRLSLEIGDGCSSDEYVIVTPSLKYLEIADYRFDQHTYLIEPMPMLEEADIEVRKDIEKILESITSVRRLSLRSRLSSADESVYRAGVVFNQLDHLKLSAYNDDWSKLLIWLLGNSPKLRVLNLCVDRYLRYKEYQPVNWNTGNSVPECLLRSLETFEFKDYMGSQEERDFLSFIDKHFMV